MEEQQSAGRRLPPFEVVVRSLEGVTLWAFLALLAPSAWVLVSHQLVLPWSFLKPLYLLFGLLALATVGVLLIDTRRRSAMLREHLFWSVAWGVVGVASLLLALFSPDPEQLLLPVPVPLPPYGG